MPRPRVVIIESDEWLSALLAKYLGDGGYSVDVESEARAGFDRVRATTPACILCALNLPDIDGFWVARRVRAEPAPVGATPFVFLTEADDVEGRLQGLNVGADLFLNKPFRAEEVVAQVGAVIEMAQRLKREARSSTPPSAAGPSVFEGDLGQMSVSTVLTVLELERRTGQLRVRNGSGATAVLELAEGALSAATLDGHERVLTELLRNVLSWREGKFQFRSTTDAPPPARRHSLSELLLEAMRLEDEAKPD